MDINKISHHADFGSFAPKIQQIWNNSGFSLPKGLLVKHENKYYYVIEDHQILFRLMNEYGQILMVSSKKCTFKNKIYECKGDIHVSLCRPELPLDIFCLEKLIPLIK